LLIGALQEIFIQLDGSNFESLRDKTRDCVIGFKEKGLSQQRIYGVVHGIKIVYQTLALESIEELADEVLDCISGYTGNKSLRIWGS
jgi:hypothetical protein